MKICFSIIFILVIGISNLMSQNPFPENGKLFQDTIIPRIDILINEDSLEQILAYENRLSFYHYKAKFVFTDNDGSDTINDIGFRLRGNTSRSSQKKSFKVSFNTFESGRKYHGVEKLNLNGEHNDPSIVRSKFCCDIAKDMGIIASRANHVDLYINDEYFGLYINVEHIDEEFVKTRYGNNNGNLYKCLYPADLNYLGTNPEAYKLGSEDSRTYDLKTNTEEDNYEDIAHLIWVLNNVPKNDFRCELEKVFNVNAYLKIIVFDILTANWDGYIFNKNNFYLYKNTTTGKFEYIPYDTDNTFGIDWFGVDWYKRDIYNWDHSSQHRPLYVRIMEDPVYRSRFTTIMKNTIDSIYIKEELYQYLEEKKILIANSANLDEYRTYDYGFSFNDFLFSFDKALDVSHVPIGINEYIEKRYVWALDQMELDNLLPDAQEEKIVLNESKDSLSISVKIENVDFLSEATFWYSFDESSDFTSLVLFDNGQNQDLIAGDRIYTSSFISINNKNLLKYYIKLTSLDDIEIKFPSCGLSELPISLGTPKLAINEFLASNDANIQDENGEYDDWLELYNYGQDSIYLGDKYLTDNPDTKTKWQMPDMWIQPKEFLIFWADKDEEQGANHCNFKLSTDGEYIGIFNSDINDNEVIDEDYFNEQQTDITEGRYPDGVGEFVSLSPTPGSANKTVGNIEETLDNEFVIYPNPVNNYINIITSINKEVNIDIISISNKIIKSFKLNTKLDNRIDISDLNTGIYIVKINASIYKLVKL